MNKDHKTVIPGELISGTDDGIVASSASIYDYNLGKTQAELNELFTNMSSGGDISPEIIEAINSRLGTVNQQLSSNTQNILNLENINDLIRERVSSLESNGNTINNKISSLESSTQSLDNRLLTLNGKVNNIDSFDLDTLNTIEDIIVTILEKGSSILQLTYSELKNLKDNSNLIPGQLYRITDFVTTVEADPEQRSAGHPFDIIVLADTTSSLNCNAKAAVHEGDTYFDPIKVALWRINYHLDDPYKKYTHYYDPSNNKGFITLMVDEYLNRLLYDFKNVQYKVYKVHDSHPTRTCFEGKYVGLKEIMNCVPFSDTEKTGSEFTQLSIPDENDYIWAYTFSNDPTGAAVDGLDAKDSLKDYSVIANGILENVLLGDKDISSKVIFFGHYVLNNRIDSRYLVALDNFNNNNGVFNYSVIGEFCYRNNCRVVCSSIGDSFQENTILYMGGNSVGIKMYQNFSTFCRENIIGDGFRRNNIVYMHDNTIGNDCYINNITRINASTIGNTFYYNSANYIIRCNIGTEEEGSFIATFGYNTINLIAESIIAKGALRNNIGTVAYSNFGINFRDNIIGNFVRGILLANYVRFNTFGNDIWFIKIEPDYFCDNIIESGNKYLTIITDATTGGNSLDGTASSAIRNVKISLGCFSGPINIPTISEITYLGPSEEEEYYRKTIIINETNACHLIIYQASGNRIELNEDNTLLVEMNG